VQLDDGVTIAVGDACHLVPPVRMVIGGTRLEIDEPTEAEEDWGARTVSLPMRPVKGCQH
jgi:hypothetical protein